MAQNADILAKNARLGPAISLYDERQSADRPETNSNRPTD